MIRWQCPFLRSRALGRCRLRRGHDQRSIAGLRSGRLSGRCLASMGRTLHDAVSQGDIAEVERLIFEGEDVNAQVRIFGSPLHIAAVKGSDAITEMLIEQWRRRQCRRPGRRRDAPSGPSQPLANAKGSRDRPSQTDACCIVGKPHRIIDQASRSLLSSSRSMSQIL
jgi:hypothetical protein